jgi:hypothetical protein
LVTLRQLLTLQCLWISGLAAGRSQYGDYFGIGVAGYPEAHPDYIVDDERIFKNNPGLRT